MRSREASLAIEQRAFAFRSPSISADVSAAEHRAMAGHRDRDLVGKTGAHDRIGGMTLTKTPGDLFVGRRLAGRNALEPSKR
jgi:hypothetical protein